MSLLTPADYPTIRAAIDTSLDEAVLPDSIISLPIYAAAGERAVLQRDPDAATRTGDALAQVQLAAIYFTAALLVPALPQISGETRPDQVTYTRKLLDPDVLITTLRARAEQAIAAVLEPSEPAPSSRRMPIMFGVAKGRRGQ